MAAVAAEQLVVDASVAVAALLSGDRGFAAFVGHRLVAPPLLWPEARSALHQLAWRGDLPSKPSGVGNCRPLWMGEDIRRGVRGRWQNCSAAG